MIVAGQTASGKTQFIIRLIKYQAEMHTTAFKRIIYVYSVPQKAYFDDLLKTVEGLEMHQGIPNELNLDGEPTLLVLDDLMFELAKDDTLARLFTRMRHENLSTIFVTQNLYFPSRYSTTIGRNAQYLVLFPNIRDKALISTLGRQIYPEYPKYIASAFKAATAEVFGYLLLDLKPTTSEDVRVRTNIFPGEITIVFKPTNKAH
jgi:hypothetical protein